MQLPRVHASWQAGMCLVWGTFLYLARELEKVGCMRGVQSLFDKRSIGILGWI